MAKVIGIDLGTTNSAVAAIEGGEPTIIPNAEGGRTTPSVVAWTRENELLVGQVAKRQSVTNAERTVHSIKRFMGRKYSESTGEVQKLPYDIVQGSQGDVRVKIGAEQYTAQEISANILRKLKTDAEAYLGQPVTRAVITVPAYFTDSQRQATRDAGRIAGLEVLRIINEPTAAALAYSRQLGSGEQTVLVFDLGGGTFDVSILTVDVDEKIIEVKATSGDNRLGGDDFDHRVVDWMANQFKADHGIDLRADRMALQRLREAAERAKIELSTTLNTNINLPFITADATGPKHLDLALTRAKFDELTHDLVEATMGPTRQALNDAELEARQIDRVILVGGSSRVPAVQEAVAKFLGKEPFKGINPDEVVALGAALQASVIAGETTDDIVLVDVTPLSLGVETLGGVMDVLITKNTAIPHSQKKIYSTAADGQTQVDIHVLQGERPMAADNKTLGRFMLDGIPPAPRGIPRIEVSFDIDVNGIVNVAARDQGTGREQKVTIQATTNLSKEEVERLIREAEQHTEEDRQRKEKVEVRNNADALVFSAQRTLKDVGEKVPAEVVKPVEEAIASVEEALQGDDSEAIEAAADHLQAVMQTMAAAVYEQQPEDAGDATVADADGDGAGGGTSDQAADETVDAAAYEMPEDKAAD